MAPCDAAWHHTSLGPGSMAWVLRPGRGSSGQMRVGVGGLRMVSMRCLGTFKHAGDHVMGHAPCPRPCLHKSRKPSSVDSPFWGGAHLASSAPRFTESGLQTPCEHARTDETSTQMEPRPCPCTHGPPFMADGSIPTGTNRPRGPHNVQEDKLNLPIVDRPLLRLDIGAEPQYSGSRRHRTNSALGREPVV